MESKENKLGTMPIPKLLLQMSLPIIISMLVQALYNIVDSVFVSRVSEDALTAVSLVFPVQNLLIAVSVGNGVGMASLLSRRLGEKDFDGVNRTGTNGIFLALCSAIVFSILGVMLSGVFFGSQTANLVGNRDLIVNYGVQYMAIISGFSVFVFMQIINERILQSTGKTLYSMLSQTIGAVVNIILDPILIFGMFGLPRLEVAGAAIATIIGQCVGMLLGMYFNHRFNKEVHLSFRGFRPHGETIKNIYAVAVPTMVVQSVGSVMTFGMNKILVQFTSTAATVFGVYFKLNSFIFMPVFGLTNGMIPMIAYNYGARRKERILHTIRLGVITAICMMLVGIALFMFVPAQLLGIFNASESMLEIGIPALRIICTSFLFAGYCIVIGCTFQAMGRGFYSLIVSIIRQLVILLPVAWIFAQTLGLHYVWWSFPIAEIFSLIFSMLLFRHVKKTMIDPL